MANRTYAEQYLDAIQLGLVGLHQELPEISAAATEAARRACADARVWVMSDEVGFVSELQHRAGGLMMLRGLPGEHLTLDDSVSENDAVVASTQALHSDRQAALLDGLRERGVAVTLIGSADDPLRGQAGSFIDNGLSPGTGAVIDHGGRMICPAASAINVAAGWTWCVELANACAALGRAPVFLMSGALASGFDRNQQHEGKPFHNEGEYQLLPAPAGQKGGEYLAELQRCFTSIRATELGRLDEIGAVAAATREAGHTVWCASIGHNMGGQRDLEGDPGFYQVVFPEANEVPPMAAGDFYIYNGYYFFPEEELRAARAMVSRSAWVMGGREIETIYPHDGEIFVNAYWRYGDTSLHLPGYDVRVVPPSGVIATAMLWLLHAAAADHIAP